MILFPQQVIDKQDAQRVTTEEASEQKKKEKSFESRHQANDDVGKAIRKR
jgi:hypothetical protein